MTAETATAAASESAYDQRAYGGYVFGAGVVAMAIVGFALGDFIPGQPLPKWFPDRTVLAYAAAAFMLLTGLALEWRRTVAWAAGALCVYYGLIVVLLMDGRMIARNLTNYGAYENTAEALAILAGALIVFASTAAIAPGRSGRVIRAGQLAFGVCAVVFGGAHFVFMNMTAPLVPRWLPPSQEFWGYATGVFHILGGLAILSGIRARLAAILLTVMYGSWTPLVHIPLFLADHNNHMNWAENATNIVLTGAAWVVADSYARAKRPQS